MAAKSWGGDGDCLLLTGKGFGLHGLTDWSGNELALNRKVGCPFAGYLLPPYPPTQHGNQNQSIHTPRLFTLHFTLHSSLTHPLTHSQHWEPCRSPVMPICLPPPFIIVITRAGPFPQFCIKSQLPSQLDSLVGWLVGWLVGVWAVRCGSMNCTTSPTRFFLSSFSLSFLEQEAS